MRRLIIALAIMVIATGAQAFKGDSGVFRDGSGNYAGSWRTQGERIEIRDGSGNLTREVSPFNSSSKGHFTVRDGDGNQVGEIDRNDD